LARVTYASQEQPKRAVLGNVKLLLINGIQPSSSSSSREKADGENPWAPNMTKEELLTFMCLHPSFLYSYTCIKRSRYNIITFFSRAATL
jgi:hypothetical protein